MLQDVLAALLAAAVFERVLVVSRDPAALELAAARGGEPLREEGRPGYRSAATQAAAAAGSAGARGLLIVPADVPLVRAADVRALVDAAPRPGLVLVAARGGRGTNALLGCPPDAVPFRFGPASFLAHLAAAAAAGLPVRVLDLPRLALDLDRPADLRRFFGAADAGATASGRLLLQLGVPARLSRPGERAPRADGAPWPAARSPGSRA